MQVESRLYRLLHVFSPTGWLVVAIVSVALASGSALLLAARLDRTENSVPGKTFDTVEQFVRDTIRLTFKDRASGESSNAVFVAPKGILNASATFKWLDNSLETESHGETAAPVAIAPARLLDPDWAPVFSGLPDDKKNP